MTLRGDISLDTLQSVLVSISGPLSGPKILNNQHRVPGWTERDAPTDHTIYGPKIAETAESDLICARDELPHDPPAASGPVIRRPERSRRLFPARSSSAERRRYGVRPQ
jgi:hypothetical protein